jgi:hypothetical protein
MAANESRSYIPRREADFDGWFENFTAYVADNAVSSGPPPRWTHIPPAKVQDLQTRFTAWRAAYTKIQGAHTSADIITKDEERSLSEAFIRPFVKQFLKFDPVTNADRINMRIHNDSHTHTTHGVITDLVESESDSGTIRQVTLRYRVKGAASRAKAEHSHGVECASMVLDHAPASVSELLIREISTANPHTLHFAEEDRGKKVYYSFRWVGTKEGMEGEWSEIHWAVIP